MSLGTSNTLEAGNTIRIGPRTITTSISGGTPLGSGEIPYGVQLLNTAVVSGDVYVGGVGTNAPFSGRGFPLSITQSISLRVKNLNQVRIFAAVSGSQIAWIGLDA